MGPKTTELEGVLQEELEAVREERQQHWSPPLADEDVEEKDDGSIVY
jgi:hypothetical protein